MKFKVGDRVVCRCADEAGSQSHLIEGKVYKVSAVYKKLILIERDDFTSGPWRMGRFELICPRAMEFDPDEWIDESPEDLREEADDPVNSPNHYSLANLDEVIDLIRRNLTDEEFRGYCKGNIMKYTCRSALKNGEQDWSKAAAYMEYLHND